MSKGDFVGNLQENAVEQPTVNINKKSLCEQLLHHSMQKVDSQGSIWFRKVETKNVTLIKLHCDISDIEFVERFSIL